MLGEPRIEYRLFKYICSINLGHKSTEWSKRKGGNLKNFGKSCFAQTKEKKCIKKYLSSILLKCLGHERRKDQETVKMEDINRQDGILDWILKTKGH